MRHKLHPHLESDAKASWSISADATRTAPDKLELAFTVDGPLETLCIPGPASAERVDGLWQHTCFEAFIMPAGGDAYYEINLSPSTRWAAYSFSSYREGMTPALEDPGIAFRSDGDRLVLKASISGVPEGEWQVGLSAVIEAKDGNRSYWALNHPQGKPDFHHRDCFALRLPPAA